MSDSQIPAVGIEDAPVELTLVDLVGSFAGQTVLTSRVSGDAQKRFTMTADGTMSWGPGNGASDVTLARSAAGEFTATGVLYSTGGIGIGLTSGINADLHIKKLVGATEILLQSGSTSASFTQQSGALTITSDVSIQVTANTTIQSPSTLTIAALTPGQILFPGTGGLISGSSSLFWDNTNETLTIGQAHAFSTGTKYLIFPCLDSNIAATYGISQAWYDNTNGSRDDAMMFVGYNWSTSAGKQDTTEPAWGLQLENYENDTDPGVPYVEGHLTYIGVGTTSTTRPFTCRVRRSDHIAFTNLCGDLILCKNSTATQIGTSLSVTSTADTHHFGVGTTCNSNSQFHVRGKQLWESISGSADNKYWDIDYSAGTSWVLRAVNDAYSSAGSALTIARSGTTISSLTLGATAIGVNGTASAPTLAFASEPTTGWYRAASGTISLAISGTQRHQFTANTYTILHDSAIILMGSSSDTRIARDAANTVAFINSNTAQKVRIYAGNGANMGIVTVNESLTIAASATTDSSTTIPAGAIIMGVAVRVTTVIPTASTFTVTAATGGNTFDTAAVSTAANSTDAGTAAGALYTSAGTKVRITPDMTPAAATGVVRLAITYFLSTPPTS